MTLQRGRSHQIPALEEGGAPALSGLQVPYSFPLGVGWGENKAGLSQPSGGKASKKRPKLPPVRNGVGSLGKGGVGLDDLIRSLPNSY